jgi:tetratricopeptide (TPR) repeat protein
MGFWDQFCYIGISFNGPDMRRKAIHLVSLLEDSEIDVVRRWLGFATGAPDTLVVQAFDGICDFLSSSSPPAGGKEDRERQLSVWLWDRLYGQSPYQDNRLRGILHRLSHALEGYFTYQNVSKDPVQSSYCLLSELEARNAPDLFLREMNRISRYLDGLQQRTPDHYLKRYRLESLYQGFRIKHRNRRKGNREAEVAKNLDHFLVMEKYLHGVMNLNLFQLTGGYNPTLLIEDIDQMVSHDSWEDRDEVIALYQAVYRMVRTRQGGEEMAEILKKHYKRLGPIMWINFFSLTTNALKHRLDVMYSRKDLYALVQLHEFGFERGILVVGKQVIPEYLLNLVNMYLRLGEVEKAEKCYQRYSGQIHPGGKDELVPMIEAAIEAGKGHYDAAYTQVFDIPRFQRIMADIQARFFKLEMKYLAGEQELKPFYGSLPEFLGARRKSGEVSQDLYHRFNNRLRAFRRLIHCRTTADYLRERRYILNMNPCPRKEWFIRQIDQQLRARGQVPPAWPFDETLCAID